MVKKKIEIEQKVNEPETAYLTTRILERALRKATRNLTNEAMEIMGYIVTVTDGWVVRINNDGTQERISKIKKVMDFKTYPS